MPSIARLNENSSRNTGATGFENQSFTRILRAVPIKAARVWSTEKKRMRLILLIIVILLLIGALPTWPYSAHWGYYPSGGLGLLLLIVIIFAVLDRA